jgi:hypothetical protein
MNIYHNTLEKQLNISATQPSPYQYININVNGLTNYNITLDIGVIEIHYLQPTSNIKLSYGTVNVYTNKNLAGKIMPSMGLGLIQDSSGLQRQNIDSDIGSSCEYLTPETGKDIVLSGDLVDYEATIEVVAGGIYFIHA